MTQMRHAIGWVLYNFFNRCLAKVFFTIEMVDLLGLAQNAHFVYSPQTVSNLLKSILALLSRAMVHEAIILITILRSTNYSSVGCVATHDLSSYLRRELYRHAGCRRRSGGRWLEPLWAKPRRVRRGFPCVVTSNK